jgi:hypothetical protein
MMMSRRRTSIVPDLPVSVVIHQVLDDFGRLGRAWRELGEEETSESAIVQAILKGQFKRPVQVVAFCLEDSWCRDVTEDIARAVIKRARENGDTLSSSARGFFKRVTGEDVPVDVVEDV